MRYIVAVLMLLAAHFSLTSLVPGAAGKAMFYWPWATDSKPRIGLPKGSLNIVLPRLLSVIAGAAFIGAFLSLFGLLIPATWWAPLLLAGIIASLLLFLMYLGPLAILPILIDAVLLCGLLVFHWTAAGLRG